MKKKIILLLCILISFIIQKGIVFAETANVSTEEQPTNNSYNVSEFPTMLSYGQLKELEAIDPYYIPVNGSVDFNAPVIRALDVFGNEIPIQLLDKRWNVGVAIDPSKPGNSAAIYYNYKNGTPSIVKVKVAYKTSIQTKNSTLYIGQEWNPKDNFVNATDENGEDIIFGSRIIKSKDYIDTSNPDVHRITYTYKSQLETVESSFLVTVKEDQTKAELKDTELYVGQKWDLGSVFKNVLDKDGNPIKPEEVNPVWINVQGEWIQSREIDTSKPGQYKVQIDILNAKHEWIKSNEAIVTVKEDQTKAELKDTELYVGQKWDLGSIFKNVVDKDGNPIKPEEVNPVWINVQGEWIQSKEIDTSKPGQYKVQIDILNAKHEWIKSNEAIVTVKEPFTIKQVPYFDFEDHILVSTNKSVVNKKENPTIELETPSIVGKDWQLQVELSPFLDKKNSKSNLKGVCLSIPKGKLESDLETEEPTLYDCQLEANGKASILMHGTKTKGKGRWKNKLETKGIILSIPSENKTGNYESTLHWTLLDVPG